MSTNQFSLDVPKALERISRDEKHETRRYSGVTILKEIALAAPSRYYHLITPVEQFFEQLFGTMTDPKVNEQNKRDCLLINFIFLAIYSRSIC
jgi:hypothetical protein